MADSVQQLAEYKLQLQQVDAALTTDPDNEDLQKLKKDLKEVLALTQQLVDQQAAEDSPRSDAKSSADPHGNVVSKTKSVTNVCHTSKGAISWKVGDLCSAIFSDDEQYYDAVIDEILEDGTCTVTFEGYGNTEVTTLSQLRLSERRSEKRDADGQGGTDSKKPKSKKDVLIEQREYKRKKNQKKAQRQKQLEEEREGEKNKWLDFNAKAFSKTNKGRVKKSIFATPDHVTGRVGVGTCGTGGSKMTDYTHQVKWKKN